MVLLGPLAGDALSRIRERDPELLDAYARDPASAVPEASLEEAGRNVLAWNLACMRLLPGPPEVVDPAEVTGSG
jgi:hypothetical protein